MSAEISREDVRPSQIQYQLLTAKLSIGEAYDSAEDAPDAVNEALAHIQTAANLLSDPGVPLSEARAENVDLPSTDCPSCGSEDTNVGFIADYDARCNDCACLFDVRTGEEVSL